MTKDINPTDAELLAPWYASGNLNDAETAIVDAEIARDPEFAKTLQLVDDEQHVLRQLGDKLGNPSSQSFAHFVTALESEPARSVGLLQRLKSSFVLPNSKMNFAMLALIAVAVLQSGYIATLVQNSEQRYQTATGASTAVSAEFSLLVAFVDTAPFGEVSALIESVNAKIVTGPTTGLYTLGFETAEEADAGLESLEAQPEFIRFIARGS